MFFSWTLHAIVYFWLMPTYIAYYTIVPRAIGGRLFSDSMGRISFILFLVVAMPIGIHHTFEDPQVGAGFKYLHSVFTAFVALPTLLTVFTICASVEIAGRLRGGKGVLGWLTALPWRNPVMLGAALSFVMLGFGGAGGLINMSYQLDATIHNTQWITGHFHLIFGGAIVIMYFVIAYDIWPHLTGRALDSFGLMRAQLWTWFVGMIVLTFPWHWVGILGMPRRMAFYDYTDPAIAAQAASVTMSVIGGAILVVSGVLFLIVLARGQTALRTEPAAYRFSVAVHPPRSLPAALNGFGLWLGLMVGLTIVNYGFPIAHLLANGRHGSSGRHCRSAVMNPERIASLRNPWFTASVGITAAIAIVAAIAGFAWLPLEHQGERFRGVWDVICSAAGTRLDRAFRCADRPRRLSDHARRSHPADAAGRERGIDRARCNTGPPMHDVSRRPRFEPGRLTQSRRAIPGHDLQATQRFQNRGAHQRSHGPAGG